MTAPEDVRDFVALVSAAQNVKKPVFRGQTSDYGTLRPSLYRVSVNVDIALIRRLLDAFFLDVSDKTHQIIEKTERHKEAERERDKDPPPSGGLLGVDRLLGTLEGMFPQPEGSNQVEPQGSNLFEALMEFGHWWESRHEPKGWWSTDEMDEARYRWVPRFSTEVERDSRELVFYAREAAFLEYYGRGLYSLARLQHYGVPTGALDVTFDPHIALWFATHRFHERRSRRGYYVPSESHGVVYLLDPGHLELGDLRHTEVVPLSGLRAERQQGALLLGATAESPDLSGHIVARLRVASSELNEEEQRQVRSLSQQGLFPPRSEDAFYDRLLTWRDRGGEWPIGDAGRWIIVYEDVA